MLAEFCQFIASEELFSTDDRLLVAVSGGLDSTALAHLLAKGGFDFGIGHCNFQLRGAESDEDAAFVRQLAGDLGVLYHETQFATEDLRQAGESIQMAARRLRYEWLLQIREKESYTYLLTAHHLYDSLETMLLNFTRGTGLAGLRGIPLQTDLIRRPLLFCARPQLEQWVQEQNISYREDASNAEVKYRRNRIRHQVLPVLEDMNPAFAETIYHNFAHLRSAYSIYREAIAALTSKVLVKVESGWEIDKPLLLEQTEPQTLLYEILQPYGFAAEQVRQLLGAKTGTLLESADYKILANEQAWILQEKEINKEWEEVVHPQVDQILLPNADYLFIKQQSHIPEVYPTSKEEVVIDQAKVIYPLKLRYWQAGDEFQPLGMQGRHQKLQDYFVNNKINRLDRNKTPLLFNGNGALIWIVGERMDERFRVTERTKEVMHISLHTALEA